MNRLPKNSLITLLTSACLLGACATTQPQGPQPEVALYGDENSAHEVSLAGLETSYGWELENPTAQNATVRSIRWNFKMGDILREGEVANAGTAQPTSNVSGKLSVKIPLVPAENNGGTPVVLRYHLKATFVVESMAGAEEMELSWHGELLAPRQPSVTAMAGAARFDTGTWEITVNIDLTNPNSFPMAVDNFSYRLFLDDVDLGDGNLLTERSLDTGATMQFDVARILQKKTHRAVLSQIGGRSKIPFRLDTQLTIAGKELSLPVHGNLEFD